jgi:hypothetical protein
MTGAVSHPAPGLRMTAPGAALFLPRIARRGPTLYPGNAGGKGAGALVCDISRHE